MPSCETTTTRLRSPGGDAKNKGLSLRAPLGTLGKATSKRRLGSGCVEGAGDGAAGGAGDGVGCGAGMIGAEAGWGLGTGSAGAANGAGAGEGAVGGVGGAAGAFCVQESSTKIRNAATRDGFTEHQPRAKCGTPFLIMACYPLQVR